MRYFLGFLVAVGLIILVILLVLRGFGGHKSTQTPIHKAVLSDYANTSTVVRLTVDGPVTADSTHRAVRVTVGRDQNEIEVIGGYNGNVIKDQTYTNNQNAYAVFLRALQLRGYMQGDPDQAKADERGYCPTRDRYVYEIVSDGSTIQRYWGSACGVGTFKGDGLTIRSLFTAQIPDYRKVTSGVAY